MDIWDKKKRSKVMAKIRSKNKKPEVLLRKSLYKKGIRYRINYKKIPGTPDIVLTKYKIAIFVHGCFWHGHENCKIAHIPKSNTIYWENKINRNKERDNISTMQLFAMGWKVLVIWECEIKKKNIENIVCQIQTMMAKDTPPTFQKIKLYEQVNEAIQQVAEDIIPYTPIIGCGIHKIT